MRKNALFKKPKLIIGAAFGIVVLTLFLFVGTQQDPADAAWQEEVEFYKKRNQWQFAVISDMDQASKVETDDESFWKAYLQKATLTRDPHSGRYTVSWDDNRLSMKTYINEKGRAMELSDLVRFAGRLYSCDDRTGIVYELIEETTKVQAIPRFILMDGDGNSAKGFKCEWGTVKDNLLYIGSFGKEYTSEQGEILNQNPMWVKIIDTEGRVKHQNWTDVYTALRVATDTQHPGYLFHESAHWNSMLKRWFFLPRRLSIDKYNPKEDESKGANTLISVSENFKDHVILNLGDVKHPTRGFSCFRFIPGRLDEILAIKSEEVGMVTASYITVFNLRGEILLEETHFVDGIKYEGLEFM